MFLQQVLLTELFSADHLTAGDRIAIRVSFILQHELFHIHFAKKCKVRLTYPHNTSV